MFSFPKLTFVFNIVPIQIPAGIFVEIKLIVNFLCECKEPRTPKTLLKNYDKVGKLALPDFKVISNKPASPRNRIRLGRKKEHITQAHNDTAEPQKHVAESQKSTVKDHMLCESISTQF